MFRDYDPETLAIFREMGAEERGHKTELEARYRERYGPETLALQPEDIQQPIEAPIIEHGELFIYEGLSMRGALEVGLRAEREARDFYRQLAARTGDEALRALYRELADTEDDHEIRLLNKIREYAEKG